MSTYTWTKPKKVKVTVSPSEIEALVINFKDKFYR